MRKSLLCLAVLPLLSACSSSPPANRYVAPDVTLEVTMRLAPRESAGAYLLDMGSRQVIVEARIVDTSRASIRSLGLWNGVDFQQPISLRNAEEPAPSIGIGFGVGMGSSSRHGSSGGGGRTGHPAGCTCPQCRGGKGGGGGTSTGVGVGVGMPINFGNQRVTSATALLAAPKLITTNDQPARLHVAVMLQIEPQINESGRITMAMIPVALNPGDVTAPPPQITTQTIIQDGHNVIISGLEKKEHATPDKVPVLKDIPVLGKLFSADPSGKQKTDLIVFVTPHIIPQE